MFVKPKINMGINCTKMYFWSKFGYSSLNRWQELSCRQAQNGIKFEFQVKIDPEDQGWSTPKSIGILTVLRCIFGPNLVTLAWTDDKLSPGQAQNDVKFDFQVKFDLEGQGRSPHKTIETLTKVFCICAPNLDWYTDRQTDTHTQTQATTIPEGQYWPRVKTKK